MPKVLIPADTTTGYIGTTSGIKSLGLSVGLTGAIQPSRYAGATTSGSPATGTFIAGDFIIDLSGAQWVCTTGGTPGTWAKIASVGATAAGASAVGDTAAAGTGGTASRVDHVHGREAFAAPSALSVSQAQASGTATSISRSDHQHAMPGSAVVGAVTGGATAAAGSASTLALSDHVHSTSNLALLDTANTFTTSLTVSAGSVTAPAVSISGITGATAASRYVGATASGAPASGTFLVGDFTIDQTGKIFVCTTAGTVGSGAAFTSASGTAVTYATPGSSAVGDSAGAGSATSVSRSDHVHGREAFGGSTTTLSFPTTGAIGSAVTLARSDHTHTLGTPVTSIVAGTGISVSGATGAVTVTNSSPGPTQVTFAESSVAPNATVYVDSITATSGSNNGDLALVPKGNGSLMAQVPDGTATGGNKRGSQAVDWQRYRDSAGQVASAGQSTIGGGINNTASGTTATIGGGNGNIASLNHAVIAGGWNNTGSSYRSSVGGGYGNTASGEASTIAGGHTNTASALMSTIPGGTKALAATYGKLAYASGMAVAQGDAQYGLSVLRGATTADATARLTSDGTAASATNVANLDANRCFLMKVLLAATDTASPHTVGLVAEYSVLIRQGAAAANTVVVDQTQHTLLGDAGLLDTVIAISADTTNGGLNLTVTGSATTNLRWVATVQSAEVG